jgi:hypothetical protein
VTGYLSALLFSGGVLIGFGLGTMLEGAQSRRQNLAVCGLVSTCLGLGAWLCLIVLLLQELNYVS